MKLEKKFKEQTFHLFWFLILFQVNSFSECVLHWASSRDNGSQFLYLNFIELVLYFVFQISLILLFDFKKKVLLSQKMMDFHQFLFNFIIIATYCEFEGVRFIKDLNQNNCDFAFIAGFFLISTLKYIKNQKLKILSFVIIMVYLTLRFQKISPLHIQRLLTVTIFFIITQNWKFHMVKKQENDKDKIGKFLKNPLLVKILQEFKQEGIAIYDYEEKLIMNNDSLIKIINCKDDTEKNLKNVKLKFESIDSDLEVQKNDLNDKSTDLINQKIFHQPNSVEEIFQTKNEISLEEVMSKLVNHIKNIDTISTTNKIENQYKTINLIFHFAKLDEALQTNEKSINFRFVITVFLKNYQLKMFLIHISNFIDQKFIISTEKNSQNNKIYYVSHEMRTPLNCIVSMLQMLKPYLSEELNDQFISPSIISCNFLLYLVQDLLDMAQLESDKFTINLEEFDIRLLISDIIQLFAFQVSTKNAEIATTVAKNIPETIISDFRRIRQIMINLIGNSLKFIPKKGGLIRIEAKVSPNNLSHFIFSVNDNGIGIREEDKKRLFKAFGKINNDEGKEMNSIGVGLGLMISNSIALNLHPNNSEGLKLESNYGVGTSFSFVVEDKTEAFNLREHDSFRNPHEIFQSYRKKSNQKKIFLEKDLEEKIKKFDTMNSQQAKIKQEVESHKIFISSPHKNPFSMGFERSFLQIKQNSFNSSRSFIMDKSQLKSFSNEDNKSIQSFGDMFICKKSIEEFELSATKLQLIRNINGGRDCDCPEILIVDDNAFNVYALQKQIENFKLKVQFANDGQEAVEFVKNYYSNYRKIKCCKNYKIIFMDIEMPGMNGYEASIEIKNFKRSIQEKIGGVIIACSAHLVEEKLNKHKMYGMKEFISKPILKEKLIILLGKYLKIESDSIMKSI